MQVLTLRLPPGLLAKVDRKAASLGRRRAEHIRELLEADVNGGGNTKSKRFACLHLLGSVSSGRGSNNAAVRLALREKREKNR